MASFHSIYDIEAVRIGQGRDQPTHFTTDLILLWVLKCSNLFTHNLKMYDFWYL